MTDSEKIKIAKSIIEAYFTQHEAAKIENADFIIKAIQKVLEHESCKNENE